MFFKQQELPKFRYVPRYYDPKKVEKERRMRHASGAELTEEEKREEFRRRIKARYQEDSIRSRRGGGIFSNQTTRFFLIMMCLLIAGLFMYAKYGDAILEFFINY